MFPLKITTSYLSFYCFGSKPFFLKCKEFSRIVCVSLFSYQGFCRFRQLIYFITSFRLCQELFSSFFKFFFDVLLPTFSLTTRLFYHSFSSLSRTFLFIFCFFIFHKKQKIKRRRRDLNPRAGYPTYTLSRGTSSASWVLLQTPNFQLLWNSTASIWNALLIIHKLYPIVNLFFSFI